MHCEVNMYQSHQEMREGHRWLKREREDYRSIWLLPDEPVSVMHACNQTLSRQTILLPQKLVTAVEQYNQWLQ